MFKKIEKTAALIEPYIFSTPLEKSLPLSNKKHNVYLKLENLQHTKSFKLRGAFAKILSLSQREKDKGLVTASTGNHGAAVAYAAKELGLKAIIFVPKNASQTKLDAIKLLGAEIRFFGIDSAKTEAHAREYAAKNNLTFISPYNDPEIIAGQGTIGLELYQSLAQIDAVIVSLGGGGLVSGIASYLKAQNPKIQIIAASPINSAVMIESVKAGQILDIESKPTLSDGTAGGVEAGSITFAFVQDLVDDFVTVSEAEIKTELKEFIDSHFMLIEGAAAVTIAAYKKHKNKIKGKNVALVLCGAKISSLTLKEVLQ